MNGLLNTNTHISYSYEDALHSSNYVMSKTKHKPKIGIVCGSGLGGLATLVEDADTFDYKDIPYFPISTAPSHAGKLLVGKLRGKDVVCMQGRLHFYEGYPLKKITFPIRVMKLMGIESLILTNASGGLNPAYKVGDVMIVKDHVNLLGLAGFNPLVGYNDERFGSRFPALAGCYNEGYRKLTLEVSKDLGFTFLHEGVYAIQGGPCFETVAESRLIRLLGADVTGMSTVPEVIVAQHCGIKCLALSLITNKCIVDYDTNEEATLEEVLETAKMRGKDIQLLVSKVVEQMD